YLVYLGRNDLAISVLSPFAGQTNLVPMQQANILVWLAEASLNKGDKAAAIRYLEDLNKRNLDTSTRGGPNPAGLAREVLPWLKGLTLDELKLPVETGSKAFPLPQEAKYTDAFAPLASVKIAPGKGINPDDARVKLLKTKFARFGIKVEDGAPFTISINEGKIAAPAKEEGYAVSVTRNGAVLQGHDKIGTTWAVVTLIQLVDQANKAARICDIRDWPETPQRGPLMSDWRSVEAALFTKSSMVADQETLTQNWGETPLRLFTVLEPCRSCAEFGINFYAGDRSLTMYPKYPLTSERTFRLHCGVFSKIAEAGGHVLFLYDDVRYPLHPEDVKINKNGAGQDAKYLTRLFREIRKKAPGFRMIFCQPFYWGPYYAGIFKAMEKQGNESWAEYNRSLKAELDPAIDVFWTGIRLVSHDIAKSDTAWARDAYGRKPFVWQNRPFPHTYHSGAVVDAIPWARMHDEGLGSELNGFAYNQYSPSCAIPIAAWNEALWNQAQSDARESVKRASELFCGKGFFEMLEPGSKAFYEIDGYSREGQFTPYILKNLDRFEAAVKIARDAYDKAVKAYPQAKIYNCGGYGYGSTLSYVEDILKAAKAAKPDYFQARFAAKIAAGRELAAKEAGFDPAKGDLYKSLPDMLGGEIADYYNKRPKDPASILLRGIQLDQARVNWLEIPFEAETPGPYELRLSGQVEEHRDVPVTWRILLNGKVVHEGLTGFKQGERAVAAYALPGDKLGKNNVIRIESTAPGGTPWNGPWIMIDYAVLKRK
ncbi:MAG: hypothetical protein GX608_03615, partial [Lentisphaerae bacterium]|nr:hypothetical protein [Lentisphaerota bacterium]